MFSTARVSNAVAAAFLLSLAVSKAPSANEPLDPKPALMYSPVLRINDGTLVSCSVLNVSRKPVRIFVEIVDENVLVSEGGENFCEPGNHMELPPGQVCSTLFTNRTNGGMQPHCKVTVFGYKSQIRASFEIRGTVGLTSETSVITDVR